MTVRLPSKVLGPLTVVVERDGERVALRMEPYVSGGMWHCAVGGDGFDAVRGSGSVALRLSPRHGRVLPVLDHWPADGVPLPDVADGPLLVCYADGAARRVVLTMAEAIGDGWHAPTVSVWFIINDREACAGADGKLKPVGPVLAWARIHGGQLDRPEMHPGDDPVESLAQEWRVSVDDVRKAMGVGRG